ncbi:hypothetical protein BAC1_00708 [uncultured bacterium]|nr:hypothetical protein BAC1_00708 [uncultured bacterium]
MLAYFIYPAYILAVSYLAFSLLDSAMRRRLGAFQGLIFGTMYFVLVPMGVLLVTGKLPLPKEFGATSLPDITLENYGVETLSILLFILVLAVLDFSLRVVRKLKKTKAAALPPPQADYSLVLLISFLTYVAADLYYFTQAGLGSGGHWYSSRADVLEQSGSIGVLVAHFIFISRILVLCSLSSMYLDGKVRFASFIALLSLVCVFDLYTTGNRIFTFLSMSLILFIMLMDRKFTTIAVLGLVAVPLGMLMNLFRYIRPFMHSTLSFDSIVLGYQFALDYNVSKGIADFILGITESVNMNVLLEIMRIFPDKVAFYGGETYAKLVFAFIPRSLWPDKPESITVQIARLFVPSETETSFASTMYGEMYANFGYFSFMLITVLVLFITLMTRFAVRDRKLASLAGFVYGITFVRMAFSDTVLSFILTSIFLMLIASLRHLSSIDLSFIARGRGVDRRSQKREDRRS